MKYLFLLYRDENATASSGEEMQAEMQAYTDFYEEVSARGIFQAGDPVQGSDATRTVQVRNGAASTTVGPLANGDALIGFYVLDCADESDAVATAAKIPAAASGAVEVLPILSM